MIDVNGHYGPCRQKMWREHFQTLSRSFNGLFTAGNLRMQVKVTVLWAPAAAR
jgi:hypothetical protein